MNTKATGSNVNATVPAQLHGRAFPESKFRQDMKQAEQEFYRAKLAKSLLDNCGPNTDFRLAYKAQQRFLMDWIMGQPQFLRLVRNCTSSVAGDCTNTDGTKK